MVAITERVRRFARRFGHPIQCSACRVPRGAGRRMIAGPGVYICEACVAEAAGQEVVGPSPGRCSFCGRRDVPNAKTWPQVAICTSCVELTRRILAEDDQRSRPAP